MAKSKLIEVNQKIAETVTEGFSRIEQAFTGSYLKIEEKFVEQYLTKDGETVPGAKERLRKKRGRQGR